MVHEMMMYSVVQYIIKQCKVYDCHKWMKEWRNEWQRLTAMLERAEPYGGDLEIAQNRGIFPSCEVPARKFCRKLYIIVKKSEKWGVGSEMVPIEPSWLCIKSPMIKGQFKGSRLFTGTVPRDWYFLEGLNILIRYFLCVRWWFYLQLHSNRENKHSTPCFISDNQRCYLYCSMG